MSSLRPPPLPGPLPGRQHLSDRDWHGHPARHAPHPRLRGLARRCHRDLRRHRQRRQPAFHNLCRYRRLLGPRCLLAGTRSPHRHRPTLPHGTNVEFVRLLAPTASPFASSSAAAAPPHPLVLEPAPPRLPRSRSRAPRALSLQWLRRGTAGLVANSASRDAPHRSCHTALQGTAFDLAADSSINLAEPCRTSRCDVEPQRVTNCSCSAQARRPPSRRTPRGRLASLRRGSRPR